jgi:hypothetical protein
LKIGEGKDWRTWLKKAKSDIILFFKDALEQMKQSKLQAAALLEEEKTASEPAVEKTEKSAEPNEEKNSEPENIQ